MLALSESESALVSLPSTQVKGDLNERCTDKGIPATGASLVQIALGLLVLSASLVFAFNQYNKVQTSVRTQASIAEINQWVGAVASLLAIGGAIDASRVISETAIEDAINIYGYSIDVTSEGRDGHRITYNMPATANCDALSALLTGSYNQSTSPDYTPDNNLNFHIT